MYERQKPIQRAKYRAAHPLSVYNLNTRTCSKCGTEKPLTSEFYTPRKRTHVPGFRTDCRDCQKEWRRPWEHDRYKTNLKHKLNRRIGNAIRWNLVGGKGRRCWLDLMEWSIDDLIRHITKQFKPSMTWENYGTIWHIDHKIPVAAFNFMAPEDIDFKRCWALKNLQPLLAHENLIKGDNLIRPFQPSLLIMEEICQP